MSEPGVKEQESAKEEPKGDKTPEIDELEEMRQKMNELSQQLKEANTRLNDPSYIEYLARKAMSGTGEPQQAQQPQAPAQGEVKLPEDFDSMTPAQFLQFVRQAVAYDVLPQVGQVAQSVARVQAELEIERTAAKYKDFNDYVPTMQKIVEANPALTPEQAYFIAKNMGSPAKEEPKKKVVPLAEKIAAELRGSGAVPGGAAPTKEKVVNPTVESVASKAFDEVFSNKE